jgi:hypothetical protein
VAVSKGHPTRLFPLPGDAANLDRMANVLPGSVVDKQVVGCHEHDFLLVSAASVQGTSRPAHFQVVADDVGFGADALQVRHGGLRCTALLLAACAHSCGVTCATCMSLHRAHLTPGTDLAARHPVLTAPPTTTTTTPAGGLLLAELPQLQVYPQHRAAGAAALRAPRGSARPVLREGPRHSGGARQQQQQQQHPLAPLPLRLQHLFRPAPSAGLDHVLCLRACLLGLQGLQEGAPWLRTACCCGPAAVALLLWPCCCGPAAVALLGQRTGDGGLLYGQSEERCWLVVQQGASWLVVQQGASWLVVQQGASGLWGGRGQAGSAGPASRG